MVRKWIYNILIVLFLSIAMFSAYKIYEIYAEYKASTDVYNDLNQYMVVKKEVSKPIVINGSSKKTEQVRMEEIEEVKEYPQVDFEALSKINNDVVGWIYFEDSNINYPIVKGNDNSYYLNHLVDRTYNSSGSIFLDERNSPVFGDNHNIIYGHHMKNGSMFSDITKYRKQSYYDSHKEALLITPDKNYKIEIFSGYVTNVEDNAWELDLKDKNDWYKWAESSKKKSEFKSDVGLEEGDTYLTLSTCSYDFDDARYVLVGRLKALE